MSDCNAVARVAHVVATTEALADPVEDGLMLMNASTERYYRLDPVGARLWHELVERGDSFDVVVNRLVSEFAVNREVAARDLGKFVEELRDLGFVSLVPGPVASA